MEPRVVAASEDEVVVLWRQRGMTLAGDRCDEEVLGLYPIHGGKLTRARCSTLIPRRCSTSWRKPRAKRRRRSRMEERGYASHRAVPCQFHAGVCAVRLGRLLSRRRD